MGCRQSYVLYRDRKYEKEERLENTETGIIGSYSRFRMEGMQIFAGGGGREIVEGLQGN